MEKPSDKVQGKFTLELPKEGDGPDMWVIHLKDLPEDIYIAATRLFRNQKDMDAMRFLLRNLWVGGDNVEEVCKDWRAVFASAEQIMAILPQAQARLKKN